MTYVNTIVLTYVIYAAMNINCYETLNQNQSNLK